MRILIVKLSSLGDVVHSLPVVADIHRLLPQAQVDWLVEEAYADLLRLLPVIDHVHTVALRRWRKTKGFPWSVWQEVQQALRALRGQRYDLVLDLQGLSKSALLARLAARTPNGVCVGMAEATLGSSFEAPARWLMHRTVSLPPRIHALDRARLLVARAIAGDHATVTAPLDFGLPRLPLLNEDQTWLTALSHARHAPIQRAPLLAIHAASRASKSWPVASWVALLARLRSAGHRVLLPAGSTTESEQGQLLLQAAGLRVPQGAAVLPVMPLPRLAAIMQRCAGVVGLDSGLTHLATALGLPALMLYNTPTAWRTAAYWGPEHVAIEGDGGAPPALSRVLELAEGWLSRLPAPPPVPERTAAGGMFE